MRRARRLGLGAEFGLRFRGVGERRSPMRVDGLLICSTSSAGGNGTKEAATLGNHKAML
jgi:hypothetical protein